ncbi:4-alpha-glucanotransferase [Porticoccus sp. GXU_MW_L64]
MGTLEKLLFLKGVSAEYDDYSGQRQIVPWEHRVQLLEAMNGPGGDRPSHEEEVFTLDASPWQRWLQHQHIAVLGRSQYLDIRISPHETEKTFQWQIHCEGGDQFTGNAPVSELEEVGDYWIDDSRYSARRLRLPDVPMGYHKLTLDDGQTRLATQLVVAPSHCCRFDDKPVWGISCQLYTLRSARNWGIGDFTDLAQLIHESASQGASMIGLNPLHALNGKGEFSISPYSPSDRRFLNPLYVDLEVVDDFRESGPVQAVYNSAACQGELHRLRAVEWVDYAAVRALKYSLLADMYSHFVAVHLHAESSRGQLFRQFVAGQGQALQDFCCFETQQNGDGLLPCGDEQFHQYLQWLAWEQLHYCQQLAVTEGMSIGLMGDLAVGATADGAEVATNPALYSCEASIGAPPDPFSQSGQNWGLPALKPVELKRTGYRHFIELLRANMVVYGALRIDHFMSLLRLWWCLPDNAGGAYVYYAFDDLLALLCLESHRNHCAVVGEDLGVVPDEVRTRMAEVGVFGNKLLFFEKQDQGFRLPASHQRDALLMVTNHDVPTLAGWWNGDDLQAQCQYGLADVQGLGCRQSARQNDKVQLLQWLASEGRLPEGWQATEEYSAKPFDWALCSAILATSARSRSTLMLLQLEDLQMIPSPVNIPGTHKEYPNWRRKQIENTKTLFAIPAIQHLMATINTERAHV